MALRTEYQFVITVMMRGDTEAEKTSCLFCNRTSSAVKLFQDVHHTNVTPWNSKVYHKRVKTLLGRHQIQPPGQFGAVDYISHSSEACMLPGMRAQSPSRQPLLVLNHPSKGETHLLSKPCRKGTAGPMLGLNQTYKDDSPGVLLLVSRDTDFPLFDIMLLLYNPL